MSTVWIVFASSLVGALAGSLLTGFVLIPWLERRIERRTTKESA